MAEHPLDTWHRLVRTQWNDAGRIVEFKVMLRPLKAINLIHQRMAAMLQADR